MDARHQPAFTSAEYQRRLGSLRERLRTEAIDTFLVFAPENICYLTGYETIGYASFATLVVRGVDDPVLLIREMERTVAETTTWLSSFATFSDTEDPAEATGALLRGHGWLDGSVALEQNGWFVSPAT